MNPPDTPSGAFMRLQNLGFIEAFAQDDDDDPSVLSTTLYAFFTSTQPNAGSDPWAPPADDDGPASSPGADDNPADEEIVHADRVLLTDGTIVSWWGFDPGTGNIHPGLAGALFDAHGS
jgi:hypothetical protein